MELGDVVRRGVACVGSVMDSRVSSSFSDSRLIGPPSGFSLRMLPAVHIHNVQVSCHACPIGQILSPACAEAAGSCTPGFLGHRETPAQP